MKFNFSATYIFYFLIITSIFAQIPSTISYQGILTDNNGDPLNGDQILTFTLYDAETNGTMLWQEIQVTPVTDGSFHVNLGEVTSLDLPFDAAYWLTIKVGSASELTPRIELTSSAYSFMAQTVSDTSITTEKIMDGAVTQAKLESGLSLPPGGAAGGDLSGNYPDPQIANQAVTSDKIDSGQVVKSINSLQDNIILAAEGGATINTNGDTLIINAGVGGGGVGVQGIQNTDNTLQIADPTGPTVTVNMQAGGITATQIADSSITVNKLDPSISLPPGGAAGGDLSGTFPNPSVVGLRNNPISATPPAAGQVLKWSGSDWAPGTDDAGASYWNQNGNNIYYNTGDVGLGTTSPNSKFHVYHNSSLSDPHILLHENGNDYARINFDNNNGSNYWTIAAYIASNNRNDRLNFWNGTSGDILTLTGDGEMGLNVGISPKVTFHVGDGHKVLFGTDTLGSGDKLMWLPDLHAFRVGTIGTGAASTYWNRDSIGLYSFASGLNTRAQGFGATAMGRDTEATNSYAFASGFFTNADGQWSTAMGFNTDALAIGSTALGYSSDALGNYSTSVGQYTSAESYASMAVGRYNVGGGSATTWNSGDPIFEIGIGTNASNRLNAVTVLKNGNVGIGTNNPSYPVYIARDTISINGLEIANLGASNLGLDGDVVPYGGSALAFDLGNNTATEHWDDIVGTDFITFSDISLKNSISNLSYGLNAVLKLRPVSYRYNSSFDVSERMRCGLIAQEVEKIIPEVVIDEDFDYNPVTDQIEKIKGEFKTMNYMELIPVLIKAIQEQQEEIEELKSQVNELSRR